MELSRRDFLKQYVLGAGIVAMSGQFGDITGTVNKQRRPNILWLIAEDISTDLGCYGTPLVSTPNINKLAAEGALYTNAFTTSPVCSPSRSAFMTGMYQTAIAAHHQRSNVARPNWPDYKNKPLPQNVKVITEYFRSVGYFMCNSAGLNWHMRGKTDFNFVTEKEPFDGTDWEQRRSNQPFFAQVNFRQTHREYERDTERPIEPAKVKLPSYYPDHPVVRRDWADYLENIQILDRKVGQFLKRLEEDGLADNTIVFFFGDNGRDHLRGKQFLYEGGIHIPLIIRWPSHIKPNTVVDDLVSAIDFGPTCMKLVGIKLPANMQGRPFIGHNVKKRECIFAARDRVDGTYDRIRCVRTERFKYIRNYYTDRPYIKFDTGTYMTVFMPVLTVMEVLREEGRLTPLQASFMIPSRPVEELYDLQNDTEEINNLADNPNFQKDLKKLRTMLEDWIKRTNDMGQMPEETQVTVQSEQYHRDRNKRQMERQGLSPDITPQEYLKYWEKQLLSIKKRDNKEYYDEQKE